jgi:long-subunit fatty acid transport protein
MEKSACIKDCLPFPTPQTNFFNFTGDGWSVGYNAGILWQPLTQLSFGATFRSSVRMNFQGNTDFQLQPGPYNTPAQRDASAQFTFPADHRLWGFLPAHTKMEY